MVVMTAITPSSIFVCVSIRMALLTGINGGSNNYLDYSVGTLYSVSNFDLARLNFTQSADTLICVHPNFVPFKLVRGATDTTWTATSLASELTIPKHAFSLSTTSPSGTITPSGVDERLLLRICKYL